MENPIRDFDINQPYTVEEIRNAIQDIKDEEERAGHKATRTMKIIILMWVSITVVLAIIDNAATETVCLSILGFMFSLIPMMLAVDDATKCNYTVKDFVFINAQNEIDNMIPRGSAEKVVNYAKQYAQIHEYVHRVSASGRDLLLMELSEFDEWVKHEKIRVSYSEIARC